MKQLILMAAIFGLAVSPVGTRADYLADRAEIAWRTGDLVDAWRDAQGLRRLHWK